MRSEARRPTLVLLPGMDGTGELFAPLIEALQATARVIRYPTAERLDYPALEAFVRQNLPVEEPYVLLGESFSGPIAISIAARPPRDLRGVILCCTFASNPHPLLRGATPLLGLLPAKPPLRLLETLLCGHFATPVLREALSRTLKQVSPEVLRSRMATVLRSNRPADLQAIRLPVLYLRAREDRVVPPSAGSRILAAVPHARLVELVAPHFLLQTVPEEAAAAIEAFIDDAVAGKHEPEHA